MSRGGRGGFGGRGGKRGPDMSWDDEESAEVTQNTRKPGPLFPDRYLRAPKPLTAIEKSGVASLISIRDQMRRGPLFALLDPTTSQSTNNIIKPSPRGQPTSTKTNPRAGFDPFNDQEKYTMKYHRKKRTVPDLSERAGYTLRLFPLELWTTLDPKRKMKEWSELTEEQKARLSLSGATASKKRKRALKFTDDEDDTAGRPRGSGSEAGSGEDEDDEDALSPSRKRKKNRQDDGRKKGGAGRQKKGLDAEDDYPDVDQQDEDADGAGAGGEDEPGDSEFGTDEEDDDGGDDYNAEQYFDDGADEADGFGDGDDDGGGGGYY